MQYKIINRNRIRKEAAVLKRPQFFSAVVHTGYV